MATATEPASGHATVREVSAFAGARGSFVAKIGRFWGENGRKQANFGGNGVLQLRR
jgi:hypothetical protein